MYYIRFFNYVGFCNILQNDRVTLDQTLCTVEGYAAFNSVRAPLCPIERGCADDCSCLIVIKSGEHSIVKHLTFLILNIQTSIIDMLPCFDCTF